MINQQGSITVDFLFAFFLVSGFSLAIITFGTTLATVEIVQYMTYSAARNYFSANVTEERQKEAALRKFTELKKSPVIGPLLNGGWFEVPDSSVVADYDMSRYPQFSEYVGNPSQNLFEGVVVYFTAKILDFQVPFFGSTKKNAQRSGDSFSTNIASFLGREPTFEECSTVFNAERWRRIKMLPNSMGAASYGAAGGDRAYVVINDNGC